MYKELYIPGGAGFLPSTVARDFPGEDTKKYQMNCRVSKKILIREEWHTKKNILWIPPYNDQCP